jgi:hypothetical protein
MPECSCKVNKLFPVFVNAIWSNFNSTAPGETLNYPNANLPNDHLLTPQIFEPI